MNYTNQELHNIGMTHIGKTLQELNYEFIGVNSELLKNPQFVIYKDGEPKVFVLISTVVYPTNPNIINEKLRETITEHAKKNNANVWFAGVGLANAKDIEDTLVKNEDYLVKFDGFIKIYTHT